MPQTSDQTQDQAPGREAVQTGGAPGQAGHASGQPGGAPDLPGLIRTFATELGRKRLGTYVAATTYCMMLSFFPILILVSAILPYTSLGEGDVVGFLLTVLPDASEGLVRQICSETYQASSGILPLSVLLMLWSAGLGMMQFTRGLNAIDDVPERRNYFQVRLTSTLYTLLVIALMLATLLLQVFVRQLVDLWQTALPGAHVPEFLTSVLRYLVLFAAGVLVFLLLFTTLPATTKKVAQQLPGALIAAVGWGVFSGIFTLYVHHSHNLNAYYGSLTTGIVLMLWVYWCLYIVLVGAYVNRFLELHGTELQQVMASGR